MVGSKLSCECDDVNHIIASHRVVVLRLWTGPEAVTTLTKRVVTFSRGQKESVRNRNEAITG